jgi:acetyltransferase-like isoleucine patch superfamily enzyme
MSLKALKIIFILIRYDLPIWLVGLLTNWLPDNRWTIRLRGMALKPFIFKCGKNFTIAKDVQLKSTNKLTIGDNVYIATGTWLNAMGQLVLEDEVVLGPYVVISTGIHTFKDNSVRKGGTIMEQVKIGKGSWLAAHVSVKAGVSIGTGNLIGANAVVTKDTPDNVFVVGVPATVVGPRNDPDESVNVKFSRF